MYRAEPDPHPVAAGIVVIAMHALLIGGLVLGLDWNRDPMRPTTVKLWSTPLDDPEPVSKPAPAVRKSEPPPAPERELPRQQLPKQEAPKRQLVEPQPLPPPMAQAPAPPTLQPRAPALSPIQPTLSQPPTRQPLPPPEPQAARPPDIALAAQAPAAREPAPIPRAPAAPAMRAPAPAAPLRPEADVERQRREEALALAARLNDAEAERQRLMREEQQRREESERRQRQRERVARTLRELNDSMEQDRARQQANAAQASANRAVIDDYIARISAKVRQRVILPADLDGNPEAVFQVDLLASGEVVTTRLLKSSGSTPYDAAVQRAILAAQPLPVPEDPQLFRATFQNFLLSFRPKE